MKFWMDNINFKGWERKKTKKKKDKIVCDTPLPKTS
jgi:hypothetical protein